MGEAGLIVITAFISPFRADRRMAREIASPHAFLEVFVDTPLAECQRRDPKGLYARATAGERFSNFTGIDSRSYEAPDAAEMRLETCRRRPRKRSPTGIIEELRRRGDCRVTLHSALQ